jgi:hypothetical protein
MTVSISRRKLAEARFFLGHMEMETRKPQEDWNPFTHYLSAFLSAARSVRFAAEKQDKARYDQVFGPWINGLSAEDKALLKFMNKQRVAEVHEAGAAVHQESGLIPITQIWFVAATASGGRMLMPPHDDYPGTVEMGGIRPQFEIGGEIVDVIPKCRKYYELLDAFLDVYEGPKSAVEQSRDASRRFFARSGARRIRRR